MQGRVGGPQVCIMESPSALPVPQPETVSHYLLLPPSKSFPDSHARVQCLEGGAGFTYLAITLLRAKGKLGRGEVLVLGTGEMRGCGGGCGGRGAG